jgi:site-specific DNA-methyltransferase (adenine-specific)
MIAKGARPGVCQLAGSAGWATLYFRSSVEASLATADRVREAQLAWRAETERVEIAGCQLVFANAFEWLSSTPPNSIHGVVTDPPYGLLEYRPDQLAKMATGRGGVWRIPPAWDGHERKPLPRFTVLSPADLDDLGNFFDALASQLIRVLVPGGHVFVATNPLVSHRVYMPFVRSGFEKRGELIRLVTTLRGGDRPKNAHEEFPDVTVMPRSSWEPWGIFRKPIEGRVQDNLRLWKTGGLRRTSEDEPFKDLFKAGVASRAEREIAPHPSLKPQKLMRHLVRGVLPLGQGVVLDPFMGSGSTLAAAAAQGIRAIGVENNREYFEMAKIAVPRLADLKAI